MAILALALFWLPSISFASASTIPRNTSVTTGRERTSLNSDWRFMRFEENPDGLAYDIRPDQVNLTLEVLKPWILPVANEFIVNASDRYPYPDAEPPGSNVSYLQKDFDDSSWETVALPHDWAIKGPFYTDDDPIVPGTMGRLPVQGVGWYRRNISWTQSEADEGRLAFLDVDGATSYAIVWLNGELVGGWPYPYNSWRLDITPYLKPGDDNVLAIRVDNPNMSSRWYPGAGIYRNVWLTKTAPARVGHYGTQITASEVSSESAVLELVVKIENSGSTDQAIDLATDIHVYDADTGSTGAQVASFPSISQTVGANEAVSINTSTVIQNPQLWNPYPAGDPNLYEAITRVSLSNGTEIDSYSTRFGIRSLNYTADSGFLVNGARVMIQGVNDHADLGAIGTAFNVRAAERQLEILREMGVNAIRMSHNPPAPELLDLTDRMGFMILDEIFDCWQLNKTENDFHLIWDDWHEADLRNMARRDRNHPSVVFWSYGNEVGEQETGEAGAAINVELREILAQEDPTRHSSASQNEALPNSTWSSVVEQFYLNYQGAGIRNTVAYSNLTGITTEPLYPEYHADYPGKMILSSESSSALSSRGTFIFPVTNYSSAPANATSGEDVTNMFVSAYELYTAGFGSSPDKVFASQDENPYVAGEFVWSGFDYLGEPTPYNDRSSYSGIVDLAGFKKDRFYIYQARWRPDLKMAHILPHWTWPEREGLVTPVHVFSSADTAELFLNNVSLGTRTRGEYEYRFRWDDVVYQPGELSVVTTKSNESWASASVQTAGDAAGLNLSADRATIQADGLDLSYITASVVDASGNVAPRANSTITFSVDGPGEIVATDNGYPADYTPFPSASRDTFNGLALVIVRGKSGTAGEVTVTATAQGLQQGQVVIQTK
ncbi:family 2 glycoside hydrolase [Cryphonectria parasitica EP155]|uniref:Family 2 glycoside hydrolase n=1 Tax=Cryphonectria parasitica (strain ATCC 38755 / EP155) TaxID=660469 RepID=A0A9P4XZM7_CRYP1|nr:family 2 glycoside hydrolase [Cryphonectria parasitica EP155]KAF3764287.1 family 2 glycoside hydrolase [Cryphonectria parasitica EP155]